MKAHIGLLVAAGLLWGCASGNDTVAGTGSQTGNTVVVGMLMGANNAPVAGAKVSLRPWNWTPTDSSKVGSARDTVTDSMGHFRFDGLPFNTYRISCVKDSMAVLQNVQANAGSYIYAPMMARFARVTGEIHLTDSTYGGIVEIYGLSRRFQLPDTGHEVHYLLDSLPAGRFTMRVWSPKKGRVVYEKDTVLTPGSVVKLDDEEWERNPEGPKEDE
jgi:Carboxypeptidase regulatory-like domain